jgi:ABC-2 type transport system permease protein
MTAGPVPAPAPTSRPAAPDAAGPGPDGGAFTGTGHLLRLALRRDRVLVPAWVLGISGMAYFSAAATVGLYPDLPDRVVAAGAVNGSAALVALYGRIYDPTSLGELSLFKMTAFGAAMVGIIMIVLAVRHTRAEEESGRLELVGAGVVGRSAPLAAGLLLVGIASTGIAVLTALGLTAAGLPLAGSIAFGAAWGTTGMLFGVLGGIAAQLTTTGRAATSLGLMAMATAYVLRAVGDLAEEGPSWLSWLSPIGWSQQVRAFSGTRWGILVLPVVATALLLPVALWLRSRRDLGAGLVADRPGPAEGRLASAWGLAWRLQRSALLGWALAASLMGLVLGSVADSVSGFLDSPQMAEFLERLGGVQGLTDMFLAAEVGIIGSIMAAYGIAATRWLHTEEEDQRAEMVLATGTSRRVWAFSHTLVALAGVAALLLVSGLAIGTGHALAIADPSQVLRIVAASATRIPAAWVMVGLAVAIWGLWPRLSWLAWLLFVAFLVMGEFGALWELPRWVMDLSPFAHSPIVPGPDPNLLGLPVLLVIAVGLLALGLARFDRRDLVST